MLLVYCDTGAYDKRLSELEASGQILIHQYKYENPSRRIRRGAVPSDLKYNDKSAYRSYDEMRSDDFLKNMSYDDWRNAESRFSEVLEVVGKDNRIDAQHLDSAYMTKCTVFLTSDKKDIWSKRTEILRVIGVRVFHVSSEWNDFVSLVKNSS